MLFCCLKHFLAISLKASLFSPKSDYLRKKLKNTQKVFFSQQVSKRANPEENLNLFKQLFLIVPVKGDKYYQKLFFSKKRATYS